MEKLAIFAILVLIASAVPILAIRTEINTNIAMATAKDEAMVGQGFPATVVVEEVLVVKPEVELAKPLKCARTGENCVNTPCCDPNDTCSWGLYNALCISFDAAQL